MSVCVCVLKMKMMQQQKWHFCPECAQCHSIGKKRRKDYQWTVNFEIFLSFSFLFYQSDIAPNLKKKKKKKKIQLLLGQHSDQSIGAAGADAQLNYTALENSAHNGQTVC